MQGDLDGLQVSISEEKKQTPTQIFDIWAAPLCFLSLSNTNSIDPTPPSPFEGHR